MNGMLGSRELYKEIIQSVYVCDYSGGAVVTLNICNRGTTLTTVSVAISDAVNSPTSSEWIEYNVEIQPHDAFERTAIALGLGQHIIVKSSNNSVNATCWGITVGDQDLEVPLITTNNTNLWISDTTVYTYAGATTSIPLLTSSTLGLTYSVTSGTLPSGLSLDGSTAIISGTTSDTSYNVNGQSSSVTVASSGASTPKSFTIIKRWRDGATQGQAAPSATYIKNLTGTSSSGYYWISPVVGSSYYVYCDMSSDGGSWMLMINAIPGCGGQYYNNVDYGLSVINGVSGVVEYNKTTTSMFGRNKINEFFKISGFKYGRITPGPGVTLTAPYTGMYQRIGSNTTSEWGGTDFDCSNRVGLLAKPNSKYWWVLDQYQNWSDCAANTNAQTGTYEGGNHYYPTTYAGQYQNFWKGDQDGLRFSTGFRLPDDYSTIGQNRCPGYFWIKTT